MFLEYRPWRPPEPERPRRPKTGLTKRQETALLWVVGVNLAMLILAPFAGASVLGALFALFGG